MVGNAPADLGLRHSPLPVQASSGPSDLSQTSAAAYKTQQQGRMLPAARAEPLVSCPIGRGLPTWKPRRPLGVRLKAAAGFPIFYGLKQPRNPAPSAINLKLQLLSNPTTETSSGRARPDKVCNLQPLPHGLQRVSEKAGTHLAFFKSLPSFYRETKTSLQETAGQRPLIE